MTFFLMFTSITILNASNYDNASAPPINDECANAISLTVNPNYLCSAKTSGTLLDATESILPADGSLGTCFGVVTKRTDDVWFKFVATESSHKVEVSNIVGNINDVYTTVYDGGSAGTCSSVGIPFYCNDQNITDLQNIVPGNTYFIRIYSNSTATNADTTFDICVGTMPTTVPPNDACADAEVIGTLPFNASYDATTATNNLGYITATGCISMNDGVWFKIVGDGGDISIVATPANSWDLGMVVYTGSCGALTCLEDSNNGTEGAIEGITFTSTVGTTYYINIAHPSGTIDKPEGIFDLAITSSTLSIDEVLLKGFTYYPNPVDRVLNMRAKEPIQKISLYSFLGKEIKNVNQNDTQAELNLHQLPAGTYFVKVMVGGSTGSFKILKK